MANLTSPLSSRNVSFQRVGIRSVRKSCWLRLSRFMPNAYRPCWLGYCGDTLLAFLDRTRKLSIGLSTRRNTWRDALRSLQRLDGNS